VELFLYLDKNTYLHHLDPRTKMFVMFASFTVALLTDSIPHLLVVGTLILAYGASGRVLTNLKRIKIVLVMIALVSVLIWSFASSGGVYYGIAMGIKLDVMIIAGMIFLSCTKIEEISLGLVRLHLPYRVAFAFSTAIRLVPMIVGTSYTTIQAQRSRGLDLDSGNFLTRIRKYVPLLLPVFISVIRNTTVFAMALESKGFGYADARSSYLEIGFGRIDMMLAFGASLIVGIIISIR